MKRQIVRMLACCLIAMLLISAAALADVSRGAKGEDVKRIQQRLVDLGYLTGKVDGDFGAMTENAVIAFQTVMGLQATGVVDYSTESMLFDPSVHAPYFMQLEFTNWRLASDRATGVGLNSKGMDVEFMLYFLLPLSEWMMETPKITLDWTDDAIESDINSEMWDLAKQGKTGYNYMNYYDTDANGNSINQICIGIILPDDPSIAGRRYIEFEAAGDKAIAYFDLEYRGNYIDGFGWKLSGTAIEQKPGTPSIVSSNAFMGMEVITPPDYYEVSESDPLYYYGRNDSRMPLNAFSIVCQKSDAIEALHFESASWASNPEKQTSNEDTWEAVKSGVTVYDEVYNEAGAIAEGEPAFSGVWLFLPDNPAIEGEQWITITSSKQRATVKFTLTYLGDYHTGSGWDIKDIDVSVTNLVG